MGITLISKNGTVRYADRICLTNGEPEDIYVWLSLLFAREKRQTLTAKDMLLIIRNHLG